MPKTNSVWEDMELAYRENLIVLHLNPPTGGFGIERLKEIHRRIFTLPSDLDFLTNFNLSDFNPGVFRDGLTDDELARDAVWQKKRPYPTLRPGEDAVVVFYSDMRDADIERLNNTLKSIDIMEMAQMDELEFIDEIAELYSNLDFAHPFTDGNSRSLREFTREVAEAAGFDIHWEVFNKDDRSREFLCGARDLGVIDVGFALAEDSPTQMALLESQYDLKGFKPLNLLMREDGFVHKRVAMTQKWASKADLGSVVDQDPFSDKSTPSRRHTAPPASDLPVDSYNPRRKV